MKYTPPMWLRHVFPWRLLYFVNRHTNTCISGMVMWKQGYEGWQWWPRSGCFDGHEVAFDYCARWETAEQFEADTGVTPRLPRMAR